MSVPPSDEAPLGGSVTVKQMIADGAVLDDDGKGNVVVNATLYKVENFSEFSNSQEEQSGHYFPFRLSGRIRGSTMTIKKGGEVKKQDIPFDPEFVFRVDGKDTTFEVVVDKKISVKLSFAGSTFDESAAPVMLVAAEAVKKVAKKSARKA